MPLIDITRPLYNGAPHWPGDNSVNFQLASSIASGGTCNVGRLSLGLHNGTHADAPFHYNDRGATIDVLAPELFVGPARVIDARGHATFTQGLFAGMTEGDFKATPRILLRTMIVTGQELHA